MRNNCRDETCFDDEMRLAFDVIDGTVRKCEMTSKPNIYIYIHMHVFLFDGVYSFSSRQSRLHFYDEYPSDVCTVHT